MKRMLAASAFCALALAATVHTARGQSKPHTRPPGTATTPVGVTMTDLFVLATCGWRAEVIVTLAYELEAPVRVRLWGSAGERIVSLPRGEGTRRVQLEGPRVDCNSEDSMRAALSQVVYLGDSGGRATDAFRAETHTGAPVEASP